MMQEEIEAWFNGKQDYLQGVELYRQYGPYISVLELLEKGDPKNDLYPEKLRSVLKKLLVTLPEVKQFKALPKKSNHSANNPQPAAATTPAETHPYILELDKQWKPLYTEMAMHHARLGSCQTDAERYQLALKIDALHTQIVDIWEQRDYFKLHGKPMPVPVKKQAKQGLPVDDFKRLLSLRSGRTQYKNIHLPKWERRLREKPTEEHKAKVEHMRAKIEWYNNQIAQYEQGN